MSKNIKNSVMRANLNIDTIMMFIRLGILPTIAIYTSCPSVFCRTVGRNAELKKRIKWMTGDDIDDTYILDTFEHSHSKMILNEGILLERREPECGGEEFRYYATYFNIDTTTPNASLPYDNIPNDLEDDPADFVDDILTSSPDSTWHHDDIIHITCKLKLEIGKNFI